MKLKLLRLAIALLWLTCRGVAQSPGDRYEYHTAHDPDGIGKFYLGREIAHVMGHEGAAWLERVTREKEERTDLLVPALKLSVGSTIADIGCGSGYYTRRLARAAGKSGLVFAVDIQPEMLQNLTNRLAAEKIENVKPILGNDIDPKLPDGALDLILMVDVYHELDHPFEMIESMCHDLKPKGRLVLVEFRGEDPNVPIKRLHKMTEAQVRKEMEAHPLDWMETITNLPQQHVIVFRKKS